MSQAAVTRILVVYLGVIWAAALLRVDHFPLTWAPMYSVYTPSATIDVTVWHPDALTKGLAITRRDGSTGYLARRDLTIPTAHFRRLYYQRMFNDGPAKEAQATKGLGDFNRGVRRLAPWLLPPAVDWEWQILWSLNRTLGHQPSEPRFIVRVESVDHVRVYSVADLRRRGLASVRTETRRATISWTDAWHPRWIRDAR
jgi:hypothetical protein